MSTNEPKYNMESKGICLNARVVPFRNVSIYGNTILYMNIAILNVGTLENVVMRNNIIYDSKSAYNKEVSFAGASWNDVPWKFEAGTPNITGVIGLGAAIDYISALGMAQVAEHGKELIAYARQELAKISGITLYGPKEGIAVVSFSILGIPPHDVAALLDREGLAVRAGNPCAMPLLSKLGVPGTVRASFSVYNAKEDVDVLVAGIKKAQEVFRQ